MIARITASPYAGFLIGGLGLSLAVATVGMLTLVERQRPAISRAVDLSYLPKGEYLRVAVLGYRQLVADLIWLKVVQHIGTIKETPEGYKWTYHAVDVLTDLDPKFVYAYQAAGTVFGVWGERVPESIAILTKGMRFNPDAWELPFYVGYDYYYELRDLKGAAKYFRMASELPGSPAYLPRLAARMTVEVGDPDAALEFLRKLYQQLSDERAKEGLVQRMREVAAERDIRFLEEGVRRYQARYQKLPTQIKDLVTRGIISQIPTEPLGGAYELRSDGTVNSTGLRERLRVYFHH
jgi:tetratricopeptide (TPR) repeat protein